MNEQNIIPLGRVVESQIGQDMLHEFDDNIHGATLNTRRDPVLFQARVNSQSLLARLSLSRVPNNEQLIASIAGLSPASEHVPVQVDGCFIVSQHGSTHVQRVNLRMKGEGVEMLREERDFLTLLTGERLRRHGRNRALVMCIGTLSVQDFAEYRESVKEAVDRLCSHVRIMTLPLGPLSDVSLQSLSNPSEQHLPPEQS